ncbi:MAG: peptidylprolyl isomerase [Drouetiella hepatica Uher 2000/2452]|uniref:Peptidyl-prolyl cis-trans isomerase n=1 Tax=Drouetiella hepatica Uher 2000/2452 TaxID=904376 RepID=A0A951UPS1_9CYAN|nr:peptidylprolyl isomerase [Drouetiella hepatica Uher 2000/2452]
MQTKLYRWLTPLFLVSVLFLASCTASSTSNETATGSGSSTGVAVPTSVSASSSLPADLSSQFKSLPHLEGEATVEMTVKGTPIVIKVDGASAPITAGNFVDLVNRGVYDGLAFHRVVREPQPFVAQGGDPQSKDPSFPVDRLGTGSFVEPKTGLPRYVPLEIEPNGASQPIYSKTLEEAQVTQPPKLRHTTGAVAMARSNPPDSASAQFYIALADLNFLDGNYAVFGYVTSGMEAVQQIQQGDRITSAKVTAGLENLRASS